MLDRTHEVDPLDVIELAVHDGKPLLWIEVNISELLSLEAMEDVILVEFCLLLIFKQLVSHLELLFEHIELNKASVNEGLPAE